MEQYDLLLINPPFHTRNGGGNLFPLGLGYIIASVKEKGYSVRTINCTDYISSYFSEDLEKLEALLLNELRNVSPKLVGIGPCITTQIKALKIIVNCCKSAFSNVPLIAGGPLASINGQEWVFFDFLGVESIVKGDGEMAMNDALETIGKGHNVITSTTITHRDFAHINEIPDLDSIPFPFRYGEDSKRISYRRNDKYEIQNTASMITSRGCAYNCFYCVSGNMRYKNFRKRSNQSIINEMKQLKDQFAITDIIFYDDCFFYNPKSANRDVEAFCSMLLDSNLHMSWQMELRPDLLLALNDGAFKLLEQSGCRQINIGIEKASDKGLKSLGKTCSISGLKEQNSRIKDISKIKLAGTFILGGPKESESDIREMIVDSKLMYLDYAHFNPLFIYPGTPLYSTIFNDQKQWVEYILNDSLPWGEIVYENQEVNRDLMLKLIDYAYSEFYKNSQISNDAMIVDRFNLKRG